MKDRGKAVEVYSNDFYQDYSTCSGLPCKKHPLSSSSVGICAYCLKDRLVKLVCSDCGEQRLSSCSCSEISSNPPTSCTGEIASVGRVFLIENENKDQHLNPSPKSKSNNGGEKSEQVFFLKRSNSSCVEMKRKKGVWSIGRLFRKKREKDNSTAKSVGGIGNDEKSDLWVVDHMDMGVSRSRSLCSFRGSGGYFGSEDGGELIMNLSGARSSISAARSSSVNGGVSSDPERKSGFNEAEPRKSGFDSTLVESEIADIDDHDAGFSTANANNRRVFSLKESYFSTGGDDSEFIDLKFDFQSEPKRDSSHSAFGSMRGGNFVPRQSGGGSCRITVNERGIKKSKKSFKGWRWIFKHNQTISKKEGDLMVNH